MGIKKSQFIANTTIPAGAYFDFVINGANRRILASDFLTAIGVTGTIEQVGEVTGTALLTKILNQYYIRNLVDGPGVKAGVSPQGGVKVEHDFVTGSTGVPILVDETTQNPKILNLLAGSGITVARSNGAIQITATGITVASNIVIVNQMSDFPAAVAGVITLQADTAYLVSTNLTTTNRFVFGTNSVLYGADSAVASITYTGVDAMFTGINIGVKIAKLTLSCPNGSMFDFAGTTTELFQFVDCTVPICDTIGTINGMGIVILNDVLFADIVTEGLSFSGTLDIFSVHQSGFYVNGGTLFDLGTALFEDGLSIDTNEVVLAAGTTMIDGMLNSANLDPSTLATVVTNKIKGAGAALSANIDHCNVRWYFLANTVIPDTVSTSFSSFTTNAVATAIGVIGTYVKVAGVWIEGTSSCRFTTDAAGKIEYIGEQDIHVNINVNMQVAQTAGANQILAAQIYFNGSPVPGTIRQETVSSSGTKRSINLLYSISVSNGDYFEIFVTNTTALNNVLVSDIIAIVQ